LESKVEVENYDDQEFAGVLKENYNANLREINQIYWDVFHLSSNRLANSAKDMTFTYREFLLMLKGYKLVEAFPLDLSTQNIISKFTTILSAVIENGSINLEHEMVLQDFQDAVRLCAELSVNSIKDTIMRLKTKGAEQLPKMLMSEETKTFTEDRRKSIVAASPIPQEQLKGKGNTKTSKKPTKIEELPEVKEIIAEDHIAKTESTEISLDFPAVVEDVENSRFSLTQ
jgi:hypothetical protein